MDSTADEEREAITASNLKRHVSVLEKRLLRNQQVRLEHPEEPERWVKSEVDLDEQIRLFRDLCAQPELFEPFEELGGLRILRDALSHPNIDIAMATLAVLNELIDPDALVRLPRAEKFLRSLQQLSLHVPCVAALLKIEEDNSEVDYEGVKSALELLESLVELFPSVEGDMSENRELLQFLLRRMKASKTLEYDSNRVHAGEILCILLQHSEECLALVGGQELDGVDKLLRIITVFRKKDPEGVEEEELVENAVQCLCRLMLIQSNRLIFGKLQGVKLLIRLIKERRSTYRLAITLLDYALMDCPENCALFVSGLGLKCIFSVLMRKGVRTKPGSEDEKREDEHVLGVIHSLCTHSSGTELARVMNKFVEHKYEKLERLIELHEKYTALSRAAAKKTQDRSGSARSLYSALQLNEDNQEYLERYEAGLSICQLVDCIILRLYNMGNSNLSSCLLVLLHNKGVNIQDIYNNISDYLEHLDEGAKDTREKVDRLLKTFLTGASDSGLFE
ncbi:beta-catenin family protein, putative [Babesia ovata]|uniref:Beta-catenin family protein, putative n=1 Tax=Babesia ovata TaxID=189622 RepID=A0A2H6K806_9APIC|nr:beta-catenin family protein, putative [Babesia ovata]GBE59089.1 beta-catenin family protein, putative [Babesia ovata]